MRGTTDNILPGTIIYRYGDRLHYMGQVDTGPHDNGIVHLFWGWNKWKNRYYYETIEDWMLKGEWKDLRSTKPKRKLIY